MFTKKKTLRIFRTYWMIFSKTYFKFLNKLYIHVIKVDILSHIAKSYRPVNICKTANSSQGCGKNMGFGLILGEKSDYFAINSTLFKLKNSFLENQKKKKN